LLTHIHFDHAGAAWKFAENGAKIYVHPIEIPHLANPEKLWNSANMIYTDKMEMLWGTMESIPEEQRGRLKIDRFIARAIWKRVVLIVFCFGLLVY
jgi:glyoxylase-like metal-dependent hydrolase (beta-lactamase superfamily II)